MIKSKSHSKSSAKRKVPTKSRNLHLSTKHMVLRLKGDHPLCKYLGSGDLYTPDKKMVFKDCKSQVLSRLYDERPRRFRDPDSSQAMNEGASMFMDPSKVYEFMLKGFSTVTTNGSGIVNVELPFDPSSSGYNFSEWADLSGLFSEVRLVAVDLTVLTTNWSQSASPIEIAALAGGINPTSQGVPGSYGAVITLADGKFINGQMTSGSGLNFNYHFSGNSWSPTSSVVITPYAGCPGSFVLYGNSYPNTTQVAYVRVANVYQFRARS